MQKVKALVQVALFTAIPHVSIAGDLPDCDPSPTPTERVQPEYPIVESPVPVKGYAIVAFTISESGDVEDVQLIESGSEPPHSGFTRGFGRSAERAISHWRYQPRKQACRSVQRFQFELDE